MTDGTARGQSETVGTVLVIGLVIAGAGLVVAIGGAGIADTQTQNELERAENSMTLFDSRAAMVALGDADSQTVSLGQDSGSMQVVDDSGWMRVTHTNYTKDESSPHEEVLFNETLGKVVYEGDDTTLAYQGGGVWRRQSGGEARMISPPEFHYRGATLTLPVIRVSGNGSATGSVGLNVRPVQQAVNIYPNETTAPTGHVGAPYNATGGYATRNYTNPVRNGTVTVTVKSEYADGWEYYFSQRTTGTVERLGNDRVRLTLETISGPPGSFQMPLLDSNDYEEANGIASGHSITEFTTEIEFDGKGTNDFGYWDLNESSGAQWELHVEPDTSGNFKCTDSPPVNIIQYYYDGGPSDEYETWEVTLDPTNTNAVSWRCGGSGNPILTVDFMSSDPDTEMSYDNSKVSASGGSPGSGKCDGNKWCFGDQIKSGSLKDPVSLDGHGSIGTCEEEDYNAGNSSSGCTLGNIVSHYMALMGPDMRIHAHNGPGGGKNAVQQANSGATLLYDEQSGGNFVTFLHITENEVEVDV